MRTDVARSLDLESNRFDIEPEITAKLLLSGHRDPRAAGRASSRGSAPRARRSAGATASARCACSPATDSAAGARSPPPRPDRVAAVASPPRPPTPCVVACLAVTPGPWSLAGVVEHPLGRLRHRRIRFPLLRRPGPDVRRGPRLAGAAARARRCRGRTPPPRSRRPGSRRARTRRAGRCRSAPPGLPLAHGRRRCASPATRAIFAVVPLMGLLAVWSTWLLGGRLAGPVVGSGVSAARRVQPDLPLPARAAHERRAGGGAVDRRARHGRSVRTGSARPGIARGAGRGAPGGAAIMMRPNLAPLAIIPVVLAWPSRAAAGATAGGAVPGVAALRCCRRRSTVRRCGRATAISASCSALGHVATNARELPGVAGRTRTRRCSRSGCSRRSWRLGAARRGPCWPSSRACSRPTCRTCRSPTGGTRASCCPALPALIVLMTAVLERAASRLPLRAGFPRWRR